MIQVPGITPPEYVEPHYPPGMAGMLNVTPLRKPRTAPLVLPPGPFSEPTNEEKIEEKQPTNVVKRKSRKARCKIIADTLDISLEEAE